MLVTTKNRKNSIPGTKYEFRVLAENRAGKSQPSETTLPQVVSVPMILMISGLTVYMKIGWWFLFIGQVKSQKAPPAICKKSMESKSIKVS